MNCLQNDSAVILGLRLTYFPLLHALRMAIENNVIFAKRFRFLECANEFTMFAEFRLIRIHTKIPSCGV